MAEKRIDSETLHAFIDGELPAADRGAAMAAIQEDPKASLDHAIYVSLKNVTSTLPSPQFPEGAWKQCVRRLDDIDRTRRTEHFVSRYAWGMCGAFFLLILGAGGINRLRGQSFDSNEMSHIASSLIPTSKASDTSKWLQDRVGSAPVGLTAVRTEVGFVDDKQVTRIILRDATGLMTLYIVQDDEALDGLQQLPNTNFYVVPFSNGSCLAWSAGGRTMSLSAQRDAASLARVAAEIQPRLGP